jgi:hypothetical protein
MNKNVERSTAPGPHSLDLRNGGWVILLAVVLAGIALGLRVNDLVAARGSRAVGDGRNPDTYGFDLSECLVRPELIVGAGMPKDGLPVLDHPPTITPARADDINRHERGKFLVPGDRVIGVSIGGQARAYPLRILNWHEVVNDTLGGVPIMVTYHPLCDSVVVFDRRVNGETLNFGISGLLYNSNALYYDRRPAGQGESLWSQLQQRAVAGPAAARRLTLEVVPASLVRWADWRALHPQTDVLARDAAFKKLYQRDPYRSYYGSDVLRFPVDPLPSTAEFALKTRVVTVRCGGETRVYPLPAIAAKADSGGTWRVEQAGVPIRFTYRRNPPTVFVEAGEPGARLRVIYAFWFAWYASCPQEASLIESDH